MRQFNQLVNPRRETLGGAAGPVGTTVTCNTTAHTKGSWASIGTTSFTYELMWFQIWDATTAADYLIDLGIDDGAGNVFVIADNLRGQFLRFGSTIGVTVILPLHVPAGAALVARAQDSAGGGSVLEVMVSGFSQGVGGAPGFSRCVSVGANTASSQGTSLTEAAITQLVATGPALIAKACMLAVGTDGNTTYGAGKQSTFELLVGSSSNEYPIIPIWQPDVGNQIDSHVPFFSPVAPCCLPPSQRFSMRYISSDSTGADGIGYLYL